MSYLLYCLLNGHRGPACPTLKGVREQAVWVLQCEDLCAAVSPAAEPSPAGRDSNHAPQIADLLAYAKVVEAFHRRESVVPMRYGCSFPGPAEVRAWVCSRAAQLRALLRRVDGCVEMGVRALPLETSPPPPSLARAAAAATAVRPGAAYLSARRLELALAQRCDRIAQMVAERLGGRFRESTAETGYWNRGLMVSLYFLVERRRLHAFRATFSRIASRQASLMLSGPWPPYNFVCGAAAGDGLAPNDLASPNDLARNVLAPNVLAPNDLVPNDLAPVRAWW